MHSLLMEGYYWTSKDEIVITMVRINMVCKGTWQAWPPRE